MPLRFSFKQAPLTIKNARHANAQAIGEELTEITAANHGRLTPEATLESARRRRSALHQHIEWDVAIAARKYQLDQCREIIRIVRVVDDDTDEQPRRAFLSLSDRDGTAYRTLTEVLDNRSLRLRVMIQAERDLQAWCARYADLAEIVALVRDAADRLRAICDSDGAAHHPRCDDCDDGARPQA